MSNIVAPGACPLDVLLVANLGSLLGGLHGKIRVKINVMAGAAKIPLLLPTECVRAGLLFGSVGIGHVRAQVIHATRQEAIKIEFRVQPKP
jgi:hypothetical protein